MRQLSNEQVALFCENMGMMYRAGIQSDEAVMLVAEDSGVGPLQNAASSVADGLDKGKPFPEALRACRAFPRYAIQMVEVASQAGRLEATMFALGEYYLERMRFQSRLRSALIYPMILLVLMTIVLLVLTLQVLPVFSSVYSDMSTQLSNQSIVFAGAAQSISYVAVAIVLVLTIIFLISACIAYFGKKTTTLTRLLDLAPFTAKASYANSLSRVCTALATYTASGISTEDSLVNIRDEIGNKKLRTKVDACLERIVGGESFAQAAFAEKLLDPLYGRMLVNSERSGAFDETLAYIAALINEEATQRLDNAVSMIEPVFAAFLTIAVTLSLFAIMIPLMGMLGGL